MYRIGETIEYMSGDCDALMENKIGVITAVSSDNFDEVKVFDPVSIPEHPELKYWSKKTKSYRSVKEKDMASIYYTVEAPNVEYVEYVELSQIVGPSSPRSEKTK